MQVKRIDIKRQKRHKESMLLGSKLDWFCDCCFLLFGSFLIWGSLFAKEDQPPCHQITVWNSYMMKGTFLTDTSKRSLRPGFSIRRGYKGPNIIIILIRGVNHLGQAKSKHTYSCWNIEASFCIIGCFYFSWLRSSWLK